MENELKELEKIDITAFQQDLIAWFKSEQRDLPWRKNQDPYKVWVSEIMLQQTRVDTVIPYFNRFMEWFPTLDDFANAEEEKILKAWEGLGYYSRVRNLHSAAKEVREQYNGKVPDTAENISKLKGIGPYTAGAILSIAYGIPEPAVDGNVMRVLSRILLIWADIAKASSRKIFESAVRSLISKEDPSSFNQALMELGALICTPTSPSCLLCPVRDYCSAFKEGVQEELPIKTKKMKQKSVQLATILAVNHEGKLLIHKRPSEGLLANLWEFPSIEMTDIIQREKDKLEYLLEQNLHLKLKPERFITEIEHIFSHLKWNISVFTGKVIGDLSINDEWKLVTIDEIEQFAFPVPHQKMLRLYKDMLV